jgi:hypothetical protein
MRRGSLCLHSAQQRQWHAQSSPSPSGRESLSPLEQTRDHGRVRDAQRPDPGGVSRDRIPWAKRSPSHSKAGRSLDHQSKVHESNNHHDGCKLWGLRSTTSCRGSLRTRTNPSVRRALSGTRFDFDQWFRHCDQPWFLRPEPCWDSDHTRSIRETVRSFFPSKDSHDVPSSSSWSTRLGRGVTRDQPFEETTKIVEHAGTSRRCD